MFSGDNASDALCLIPAGCKKLKPSPESRNCNCTIRPVELVRISSHSKVFSLVHIVLHFLSNYERRRGLDPDIGESLRCIMFRCCSMSVRDRDQ